MRIFFIGMLMGIADLIPGVSGGTIAFIMGIYERLIGAIKGVSSNRWDLAFLLPLVGGIAFSIISFSHLLEGLLNHPVFRTNLFAVFLGMILGSIIFCSKQVKEWSNSRFFMMGLGILIAFLLTGHLTHPTSIAEPGYLWVAACGMIAVSAMLLPGVSGSYLLTMLGMYPIVLQNLNAFTGGLVQGTFNPSALFFLFIFLCGIIFGAVLFSRVVSWTLTYYHDLTIAALTGFMLGGLQTVWPFWIYDTATHPLQQEKGMILIPREMILPDLTSQTFWLAASFCAFGCLWVIWIEGVMGVSKTPSEGSARERER